MSKKPIERKLSHTRKVTFMGFERSDGLWDIEAHLNDSKPSTVTIHDKTWDPLEPIHDMLIRLTLNAKLKIMDIHAVMNNHPLLECPDSLPPMKNLIGIQIGRGWRAEVNAKIGKTAGCSHLKELLYSMATVAYQTIRASLELDAEFKTAPHFIDGCYAWRTSGDAVLKHYPQFHRKLGPLIK